jgi:TolB-like protein
MRRGASVAVACSLVIATSQAPAAARSSAPEADASRPTQLTTAILPIQVVGELSEADQAALADELVRGLRRGSFGVVAPEDVARTVGDVGRCEKAKCIQKVGKSTSASHVVRAKVEVLDRDYSVEVELLDARSGQSIARNAESCEICGIADAGAMISTAAATLRTKLDALAKGPSILAVVSEPSGAEVRIDGDVIGVTPLQRPVVPGKRVLRISREGYVAIEREVTVVEGIEESLAFELEKVPSRLPSRPWGWVSLGLGIGSVGAAVAFAVLRDRPYRLGDACEGDNVDARGNCRRLWNTEYHVLGFALAGATLTTLGVAILLNTTSAKRQAKRSTRVGLGPGSVTVRGRF